MVSRNTINSAYDYSQSNSSAEFNWKMSDWSSFASLKKNDVAKLMNNMADFVQACFTCEGNIAAGISGGTITTKDRIDAAFAAISNTYS